MKKTGLVLEGGGMRGIYTAGVLDLFLEKTPNGISITELKHHLCEIDGVSDIHHIHLWSMDHSMHLATMHVVITPNVNHTDIKNKIHRELTEHGINHVTIEIEQQGDICSSVNCTVTSQQPVHHHHHHH